MLPCLMSSTRCVSEYPVSRYRDVATQPPYRLAIEGCRLTARSSTGTCASRERRRRAPGSCELVRGRAESANSRNSAKSGKRTDGVRLYELLKISRILVFVEAG